MTDSPSSTPAVDALRANAQARSSAARKRIDRAIKDLRKRGAAINVKAVSEKAHVARKTIYGHPDLLATIRAHAREKPVDVAPHRADTGIIEALRSQLTAKDTKIRQLRDTLRQRDETIARLYGEIARLTD